jgi:hypothetical protein
MLGNIFGGKTWYKSMTAWGVLFLTVAWTIIPEMANLGLITVEGAGTLTKWLTVISGPLNILGIRRAAQAPNVGE